MNLIRIGLDILFPQICAACQKALPRSSTKNILCAQCEKNLTQADAFTCPTCRGRIPFYGQKLPARKHMCHPGAPYLVIASARYDNQTVAALIHQLKFKRHTSVAQIMAGTMVGSLKPFAPTIDCIIPVPLAAKRLRQRGFNQAELLARVIARDLSLPCLTDVCRRIRNTQAQTKIKTWVQRQQNLVNSFRITNKAAVQGKTIVLVDDVWTSGATMTSLAREFEKAGTRRIIACVVARV